MKVVRLMVTVVNKMIVVDAPLQIVRFSEMLWRTPGRLASDPARDSSADGRRGGVAPRGEVLCGLEMQGI